MYRALYSRTAATRAAPLCARPFMAPRLAFRFNSTDAKKEDIKENIKEDIKEDIKEELKEEAKEPSELEKLKSQLAQKDKDLADMKNHYARAVADFRNLQESTKKEVQKAKDFALQKFAKDLLESADNFALALNAVKEDTLAGNEDVKNLHDGVSMTKTVFEKTLARHGIEKIEPLGEQFDPNLHEATFEIPQPDKQPGTVFHVQQPGYTLNARVLRPAKVGLVKDNE